MDDSGRVVEVVAYDPSWPDRFELERQRLADVLPGASSIEHVGSTSVRGLAAKPIIDIVVVVPDAAEIAADVSAIERLGYVFRPLAFPQEGDHLVFVKDTGGRRTHHLHVFGAVRRSRRRIGCSGRTWRPIRRRLAATRRPRRRRPRRIPTVGRVTPARRRRSCSNCWNCPVYGVPVSNRRRRDRDLAPSGTAHTCRPRPAASQPRTDTPS